MDQDQGYFQEIDSTHTQHMNRVAYIDNDVSMSEWLVTILLSSIPFVNFIFLFIWAFDSSTKPSKANWARATLVFAAISIVFLIIVFIIFGSMATSLLGGGGTPSFY